ncbi:unnamed protein product [Macrosiphum euphorbiae]|uniref:Uncharacterized protein n=1 Tax=Macrosiphum euphorbiae TaxID=13131 RepID=A0AAV0WEQ0_9HEMI|nr:unnamed protein product [Macrosiphum euphorbiae]
MPTYNPMEMFQKIVDVQQCTAMLITNLKMKIIIRFEEEHCHGATKGAIRAMKIKQTIKECSLQTCNNPGQIFAQAVQNVPKEILIELPSEDSIKRSIRILRSSLNPKKPKSLQELVIECNLHYLPIIIIIYKWLGLLQNSF